MPRRGIPLYNKPRLMILWPSLEWSECHLRIQPLESLRYVGPVAFNIRHNWSFKNSQVSIKCSQAETCVGSYGRCWGCEQHFLSFMSQTLPQTRTLSQTHCQCRWAGARVPGPPTLLHLLLSQWGPSFRLPEESQFRVFLLESICVNLHLEKLVS